MKKTVSYFYLVLFFALCCNWGSKDDASGGPVTGGGRKPDVNVYGMVQDNTGNIVRVENILIGSRYNQIPVYLKPQDLTQKNYNPSENVARLDLAEISKIYIENRDTIYSFSNRPYLEITVLSNDNTTINKYIVETSKKVTFDEVNDSGPIEREVSMLALHELIIQGYERAVNGCKPNIQRMPMPTKTTETPAAQPAEQPQKNDGIIFIGKCIHPQSISSSEPMIFPGLA